jgi:hypothetical protein
MRLCPLLLVAALTAGCAGTEVTAVFGSRTVNGDTEPGGMLLVAQRFGERGICFPIAHLSDPTNGRPFNTQDEINDDFRGCGWTWRRER